uniref:Solute carrier family 22 member 1-like n=1 Tax=Petromyzon marinus TaxID=7757 RepID=A0AAJ7WMP7_PETMA|nr:solute carrier family 22 member 1-like [Petromyzon marinus]
MADFDSLLQGIGEFGPFQHRVFAMLCLPCTLFAFQYLNIVFLGQVPEHRCRLPTETRRTSSRCGASLEAAHRNRSRASGSLEDQWNLQCMRVNTTTWSDSNAPCGLAPWGQGDEVPNVSFSGRLIACDHGWEFDTEKTGLTLVSEVGIEALSAQRRTVFDGCLFLMQLCSVRIRQYSGVLLCYLCGNATIWHSWMSTVRTLFHRIGPGLPWRAKRGKIYTDFIVDMKDGQSFANNLTLAHRNIAIHHYIRLS